MGGAPLHNLKRGALAMASDKAFTVTLNDVTYQASRPKGSIYREYIRLQEKYGEVNIFSSQEIYDAYFDFAIQAFGHPEVTKEKVEAEIYSDELLNFILDSRLWIQGIVKEKNEQLPKSRANKMS